MVGTKPLMLAGLATALAASVALTGVLIATHV